MTTIQSHAENMDTVEGYDKGIEQLGTLKKNPENQLVGELIKDKLVDISHLDQTFEEFEETYDITESLVEIEV